MTNNGWAKGSGAYDFTTTSGNTCKIRPVSLPELVFDGVIDNIDTLSNLVNSKIAQKKTGKGKKTDAQIGLEMLKEGAEIKDALKIMDKVVCHVVIEPNVQMVPEDPNDMDDDVVYITAIPQAERLEIFQEAVKEIQAADRFRSE